MWSAGRQRHSWTYKEWEAFSLIDVGPLTPAHGNTWCKTDGDLMTIHGALHAVSRGRTTRNVSPSHVLQYVTTI